MLRIEERRYSIRAASQLCRKHHSTIERAIKAGRLALTADRKLTLAALRTAGFTPQERTTEQPSDHEAPMTAALTAPAPIEDAGERTARAAEDLLARLTPVYPRGPVELRLLETLRHVFPLALSPKQLSVLLDLPGPEVHRVLQALAVLGTIAHPARGLYRHRPPQEVAP
jgi:hypothetical protein